MGGCAALAMLRRAASRVRAVVLTSARSAADTEAQAADRRRMAERALVEGVEFIVDPMAARLLGPAARAEPHVADPVRGRIRRCRPEGIAACQSAMASRPDSGDLLASLTMPVLVVAGEHDAVMSPEEAEALAAALPAGELAVPAGVGHLANLEGPAAFTEILSGFLSRTGG
jgi:pimeloyl-ACP methyl ester carboxylesterase